MKTPKILIILICILIFLGASDPAQVKGDAPFLIYAPVVSNIFSEQRLGPYNAKVTAVVTDPKQFGVIYAGTWGNGIYKSVDAGATWMPVNRGLGNLTIQSLAVDPNNSQNVYAGAYYNASAENGVFKSTDGGMSWQVTGKLENSYNEVLINRPIIYSLVVSPSNSNVIFAGTRMSNLVPGQAVYGGGGVFKTTDQGQTWTTVNRNLPSNDLYVYDLAINPSQPNQILAALHVSGAFMSSDGGGSWSSLTAGTKVDTSGRAILMDSGSLGQVFYGTWHEQGVYFSDNLGADWSQKGVVGVGGVLGLAQDPNNHNYLLANIWQKSSADPPSKLYISSDHGNHWKGNDGEAYYQVAFDSYDGSYIYGGTDNGVKISNNRGASWFYSNLGLVGYSNMAVAVNPASPKVIYAAIYNLGVAKSIDQGATWSYISSGLPGGFTARSMVLDPKHPDVVYVTSDDAGIYRTTNGGANWTALAGSYPASVSPGIQSDLFQNRILPEPEVFGPADVSIQSAAATFSPGNIIAVAPDSSAVLVGTGGHGVLRFNGAAGWLASSLSAGSIHAILFDAASSGRVLAGAGGADGSLFVSSDNGATWAPSASGLAGRTVYAISQSPDKPDLFWAGTDAGVYRSEDKGGTWVFSGLENWPVTTLNAHPAMTGVFMAGTPDSMFMSHDYGLSWEKEKVQLDGFGVQGIVQDPSNPNYVYLATRFGGVIRVDR